MGRALSDRLDYFYSFRSPYSYLSAPRAFALPDRFDVELAFHGVIPMAMRGQSVPRAKQVHTIRDVAREARRLQMPFGRIHDPLGEGARRCLLVAAHARREGRVREFVLCAGRAIWGEAVEVASDEGLQAVCERAGLSWQGCRAALTDEALRQEVDRDTEALIELGHWGVPVLVVRGEPFWGQDRIEDLEAELQHLGLGRSRITTAKVST
jgi:2-hydroxychromene-2-carboxylate isomerase